MRNNLNIIIIFLISSLLISVLLYFQIKIIQLQQILLVLIAVLLIALRFFRSSLGKKALTNWLLTFIVTFFIQVLIASSGAVFSPFFILIHIYVIGLSLFFDFWIAMSFLVLEFAVLVLNIYFSPNLLYLVKGDFGSVLLYFFSVLAITPVSKFISQQYHIKSDTLKVLFKELSTQESIIEQVGDFLITTDKNLTVLQTNDSAKKVIDLSKSNELIDLIDLVDEKGNHLTKEGLLQSLASLIQNEQNSSLNKPSFPNSLNLILKGYTLKIPNHKVSPKVIIRITPIMTPEGMLEKFIFLIGQKGYEENADTAGDKFKEVHTKFIYILNILKQDPVISKLTAISLYLITLQRYEEDLLATLELNLHPVSAKVKVTDIFRISIQLFNKHQQSAKNLNIDYELNLPDKLQDEYRLKIADINLPEDLIAQSSLSAATDPKLIQILIDKTFDTATAVAYGESLSLQNKKSVVILQLAPFEDYIKLSISVKMNPESKELIKKLSEINKGNWDIVDNLALSSSLESYIFKKIINLLSVSFEVEYNQYNHNLSFNLSVDKHAESSSQ